MPSEEEIEARPQHTDHRTEFYYDDPSLTANQRRKYRRLHRRQSGEWKCGNRDDKIAQKQQNREAFRVVASNCDLSHQQHVRADTLFATVNEETTVVQGYDAETVALAVCIKTLNESVPGKDVRWKPTYANEKDCFLGQVADNLNINRKHLGRIYHRLFLGQEAIE